MERAGGEGRWTCVRVPVALRAPAPFNLVRAEHVPKPSDYSLKTRGLFICSAVNQNQLWFNKQNGFLKICSMLKITVGLRRTGRATCDESEGDINVTDLDYEI